MIWTLRTRSRRLSSGERVGRVKVPVEALVMTERSAMSAMTAAKATQRRLVMTVLRRTLEKVCRSLSRLLKTTWASGDDVDEVGVQQEQANVADVAEDGRQVLDEIEVAVDEDGYAESGGGAAVSGRTSNDMQKPRGWDDSGDDCAGTSPDFYPAAPPDPSLSDKFQPQLDV